MVVGKKIALGRIHEHQTASVLISETALTVEFGDGDVRLTRRNTTQPVSSIKGPAATDRYLNFLDHMSHSGQNTQGPERRPPSGDARRSSAG